MSESRRRPRREESGRSVSSQNREEAPGGSDRGEPNRAPERDRAKQRGTRRRQATGHPENAG